MEWDRLLLALDNSSPGVAAGGSPLIKQEPVDMHYTAGQQTQNTRRFTGNCNFCQSRLQRGRVFYKKA